jgi:very-short-patch-repair endonuclease
MSGELAKLLERQHGRVARWQLLALGLSGDQVDWRVKRGRLRRLHQGVYAVAGAPPSREGLWMAAVLAAGESAALSHRSAAELWGLIPGCSMPIHVTVPGTAGRAKRGGLVIHRGEVPSTIHRGVPVTTPLRTLVALRTTRRVYEHAVAEAQRTRRISKAEADGLLPEGKPPSNRFERLFLRICEEHGIPKPTRQAEVGPYRVDFLWPAQFLVVETDGHATHGTRTAFEDDRARDAELATRGYRVLRFTWRQLTERPGWVAQTVLAALRV